MAMANRHSEISVPIITEDDLRDFHQSHFPGIRLPHQFFLSSNFEEEEYYEDDEDEDGLGYYSDGVKRTLTDTQISIFRHSEIQRILRKEAGDLSGPIFPTQAIKQRGFKTHVHNKDRLKEKTSARKVTGAEKAVSNAAHTERQHGQKLAQQGVSPISTTTQSQSGTTKKRKKKKSNPSTITHNAKGIWKPKHERSTNLTRRNTSSPEPEPETLHTRKKVKEYTAAPNRAAEAEEEAKEIEARHDPEEYKSEGEAYTYRRLARDEDDVPTVSVELDY